MTYKELQALQERIREAHRRYNRSEKGKERSRRYLEKIKKAHSGEDRRELA